MNKSDLINYVAKNTSLTKADSEKAINCVFKGITGALSKKEEARFTGFGSFSVIDRAPRVGRNPKTGEQVRIPPRRSVKFCPGQALKQKFFNP